MHTATRLAARLAERVRALNPDAHLVFYGLYASLHADVLVGRPGESAIGGEYEVQVVAVNLGKAGSLKKNYGDVTLRKRRRRIEPLEE